MVVNRQLGAVERRETFRNFDAELVLHAGAQSSKSRKKTLLETLAPSSRQMRPAADSNAQPRRPNTPALEQLEMAKAVEDGHTCKCMKTGEEEGEIVAEGGP